MEKLGDWYDAIVAMPLRARLVAFPIYVLVSGLFVTMVFQESPLYSFTFAAWLWAWTYFLIPALVVWWRRRPHQ